MTTEAISPSDIYWITRCDAINSMFLWFIIPIAITCVITAIVTILTYDSTVWRSDDIKDQKRIRHNGKTTLKWLIPIFTILVFANGATPTTREAIAIVVIPKIANNEQVQGLGQDMIDTARDWLKELAPKKQKEEK